MYLFDAGSPGIIPNNDIIVTNNFGQLPRFQCISGSLTAGVGQWISPSGQDATFQSGDPFDVIVGDESDPGYLDVSLHSGQFITYEDQGVYTCQIPDDMGTLVSLHVGIYLPALTSKVPCLLLHYSGTKQTDSFIVVPVQILSLDEDSKAVFSLNCTSTGSPPTNLTWTKDGEVITGGDNYEVIQILRSGVTATYSNILKIHLPLSSIIGAYTCMIDNSVSVPVEQTLTIQG